MKRYFLVLLTVFFFGTAMGQNPSLGEQNTLPRFVKSVTVGENRYVFQYKDASTPQVTAITCVTPYGSSETRIAYCDTSAAEAPVALIHHGGAVDTLRYRLGRWAYSYSDPIGDTYTDEYLAEATPEGAQKLLYRWRTCINSVDVKTTEAHKYKYVRGCLLSVNDGRSEIQWKYGGKAALPCTIDLIHFVTVGFVGGNSLYAVPQVLNNFLAEYVSGVRLPISAVDNNVRVTFSYKMDDRDYVSRIRMRGQSFTGENDFDVKVEVEYMNF